jgi:hypothetical protein
VQKWECLWVQADNQKARWLNSREIADWKSGPHWLDFIALLGDEGWELVTAGSSPDLLYFKRPK